MDNKSINEPNSHPLQDCNQEISKKAKKSQKKHSPHLHWSMKEQKKYVSFLITKRKFFQLPLRERKLVKIHSKMSSYIKSRIGIQCRSHHQKMLLKYESLDGIIQAFRYLFDDTKISNPILKKEYHYQTQGAQIKKQEGQIMENKVIQTSLGENVKLEYQQLRMDQEPPFQNQNNADYNDREGVLKEEQDDFDYRYHFHDNFPEHKYISTILPNTEDSLQ